MGDIMKPRMVRRLRAELEALRARRRSLRSSEVVALAKRIGRKRVNRGKEPTYERTGWLPLTIPGHSSDLAIGTASNILDQLEEDIERLEAESQDQEEDANEEQE